LENKMRIAIVNDLTIATSVLKQVVQTVPEYQIIWTAKDGVEALARCIQDRPDLILMDLLLPVMDGVEATRRIMKQCPCGILIVTASTERSVGRVYEAMCHGALDAIDTPVLNQAIGHQTATALLSKISTLRRLIQPISKTVRSKTFATVGAVSAANEESNTSPRSNSGFKNRSTTPDRSAIFDRSSFSSSAPPLIAIGSSTGGPKALAAVLSQLPVGFGAAIAVVQHVDAQFSSGLANWLAQQIQLPVRIAKAGETLEPGVVLLAGSNDHLEVKPNLTLGYTKDPIDYPYRPSVDVFFNSVAEHWTRRGTAVLLTGMGRDGAKGLLELRSRGWNTIAQDKSSCVVYGMPKAAIDLNAAVEILAPDAIATALLNVLKPKR
jgi:two-component system, chemotaxis family, response regulator WspF